MNKIGRYGVLNIVLHPHPVGAYRSLFQKASEKAVPVNYFGDKFATLSPISPSREGIFTGRIATWTELDREGNLIDKNTLDEILFSDAQIEIPKRLGFNSKIFNFAFRESDHRMFVELINDENEKISIATAQKIVAQLLSQMTSKEQLMVHVVSENTAIEKLLSTPGIKKIEIVVNLPNPDVLTAKKAEVLAAMHLMNARRIKFEMQREAGEETLVLTPGVRELAELGSENGFVKVNGRDDQGAAVFKSTSDFPQELEIKLEVEESRAIATRRVAAE